MASYFEIQGCPKTENKKRKYLRRNGETAKRRTERKWEANEDTGSSLRERKTRRLGRY